MTTAYKPTRQQQDALIEARHNTEGVFTMSRRNDAAEIHLAIAGLLKEDWAVRGDEARAQIERDIADGVMYAQAAMERKQFDVAARALNGAAHHARTLARKRFYITAAGKAAAEIFEARREAERRTIMGAREGK